MKHFYKMAAAALFCTAPAIAHSAVLLNLNADDLALANGDVVASWDIATGSGTPTYLTNQTPLGFAAVEFNGSDHFGTLAATHFPTSASGDLIFAGLIKATNTGAYHNIIDDDAGNRPMLWIDGSDYELNAYYTGAGALAIGAGVDGWDVFIANSKTGELWINSVIANASSGAYSYNLAEAFDLFNRDGGQTFQGLVADFRVYNSPDDFGGDYAALNADLSSKLVAAVPGPASLPLLLGAVGLIAGLRRRAARSL